MLLCPRLLEHQPDFGSSEHLWSKVQRGIQGDFVEAGFKPALKTQKSNGVLGRPMSRPSRPSFKSRRLSFVPVSSSSPGLLGNRR